MNIDRRVEGVFASLNVTLDMRTKETPPIGQRIKLQKYTSGTGRGEIHRLLERERQTEKHEINELVKAAMDGKTTYWLPYRDRADALAQRKTYL